MGSLLTRGDQWKINWGGSLRGGIAREQDSGGGIKLGASEEGSFGRTRGGGT